MSRILGSSKRGGLSHILSILLLYLLLLTLHSTDLACLGLDSRSAKQQKLVTFGIIAVLVLLILLILASRSISPFSEQLVLLHLLFTHKTVQQVVLRTVLHSITIIVHTIRLDTTIIVQHSSGIFFLKHPALSRISEQTSQLLVKRLQRPIHHPLVDDVDSLLEQQLLESLQL